jgi:hypothetical protein
LQIGISNEHTRSNQLALVDTMAKIVTTVKEMKNEKKRVDLKVFSGYGNVSLELAQQDTTEKRQGLSEEKVDVTIKGYAFTPIASEKRPRNLTGKEGNDKKRSNWLGKYGDEDLT